MTLVLFSFACIVFISVFLRIEIFVGIYFYSHDEVDDTDLILFISEGSIAKRRVQVF